MKKLRLKEQKARDQLENDIEVKGSIRSSGEEVSPEEPSLAACDFEAHRAHVFADQASSPHVAYHCLDTNEGVDGDTQLAYDCDTDQNVELQTSQLDAQSGYDCDTDRNLERQTSHKHNPRRTIAARRLRHPKSQRTIVNGLHASQNSQKSKSGVIPKYGNGTNREQRAAPIVNSGKVWSPKPKPEIDTVVLKTKLHKEPDEVKTHEVLIGSVSVTLVNCSQSEGNLVTSQANSFIENSANQNIAQEKPIKPDSFHGGNNRSGVKLWRPVSQHETKNPPPLQSVETEVDVVHGKDDQNLLCDIDGGNMGYGNKSHVGPKADSESFRLSSDAAKAFLAQSKLYQLIRINFLILLCFIETMHGLVVSCSVQIFTNNSYAGWKEAISSHHVELVISPDSESPRFKPVKDCATSVAKSKPRMKPEKGIKIKYIPRLKAAA